MVYIIMYQNKVEDTREKLFHNTVGISGYTAQTKK